MQSHVKWWNCIQCGCQSFKSILTVWLSVFLDLALPWISRKLRYYLFDQLSLVGLLIFLLIHGQTILMCYSTLFSSIGVTPYFFSNTFILNSIISCISPQSTQYSHSATFSLCACCHFNAQNSLPWSITSCMAVW